MLNINKFYTPLQIKFIEKNKTTRPKSTFESMSTTAIAQTTKAILKPKIDISKEQNRGPMVGQTQMVCLNQKKIIYQKYKRL